jgi:hypothetical protein
MHAAPPLVSSPHLRNLTCIHKSLQLTPHLQGGSITVDSVSPAVARRLLSGIVVTSTATVKSPTDADSLVNGISSKIDHLTSTLRKMGLTAATVMSASASVVSGGTPLTNDSDQGAGAWPGGVNVETVKWTLIAVGIALGECVCVYACMHVYVCECGR